MNKLFLMMVGVICVASVAWADAHIPLVPARDHEAVRARIIDPTPAQFKINVKYFANMGVNEDAPTFAVYVASSLPKSCADFRALQFRYLKPTKYERVFDLSKHPEVIKALDDLGCVVIKNIPAGT
jgi:hypothetical protein